MAKIVIFVNGGNVSYVGSNLEELEFVLVDGDNLHEMGYSDEEIKQIEDREVIGLKEVALNSPIESTEFMIVQSYKPPAPWEPTVGKWCWEEVAGIAEFKITKFNGEKEGCNYYKFDGVLPIAEVLQQQERINPQDIIRDLIEIGNPEMLNGDCYQKIKKAAPDAPYGFDVNIWNDGHGFKMTAFSIIKGNDEQLRTSSLHPLITHDLTPDEVDILLKGIDDKKSVAIQQMANGASAGKGLLDVLDELEKSKQNFEPKV